MWNVLAAVTNAPLSENVTIVKQWMAAKAVYLPRNPAISLGHVLKLRENMFKLIIDDLLKTFYIKKFHLINENKLILDQHLYHRTDVNIGK